MDVFSVLTLLGGLAFFLYGMKVMGDGLESLSGGKLEKTLEKMTNNRFKGVLVGAGVTALIQSSSATTVMVVGFVNSGIMRLTQAIGIIMGANIGTTITAWILSLTGLEGDSIIVKLLKPTGFGPILAFIGIILLMANKRQKGKQIGTILIAFAVLMTGMDLMGDAVKPLAEVPEFQQMFLMFENPLLGIMIGALLTALLQSSSASVGILQTFASTGIIKFSMAFPIILGQNIGTCITAMLSCIGAKKNAKRAAFVHLYFNIIGTVVIGVLFYVLNAVLNLTYLDNHLVTPADIAIIHTSFNLLATAMLLPFSKYLGKLACLTIKDKEEDDETPFLDERFLTAPAVAIEQCNIMSEKMITLTKEVDELALNSLDNYSEKLEEEIRKQEDLTDKYEDVLGTYLVRLSRESLNEETSKQVTMLLQTIGEIERLADVSLEVLAVSKEMYNKKMKFSSAATEELKIVKKAVNDLILLSVDIFERKDENDFEKVDPLYSVVYDIIDEVKENHVIRLRDGCCTIELGFVLADLLQAYEKMCDACLKISQLSIRLNSNNPSFHIETSHGKKSDTYAKNYDELKEIYVVTK